MSDVFCTIQNEVLIALNRGLNSCFKTALVTEQKHLHGGTWRLACKLHALWICFRQVKSPKVPLKEKVVSHHPWDRVIKDVYANKMKYSHNSVNNPRYPKNKEKEPDKERVKFTVIGNRITKEFIYCVKLVNGMHKYRWKNFDSPVVRGVTTIEWPHVWNDLKIRYGGTAYCLKSQVAILVNDKFLGGEQELKELIESKYIYNLSLDYYNESIAQFAAFVKSSGRPCAYLHISINNEHIGTMIFMLYADIVPNTCENFLRLCKTKKGGYAGTPVHRIVKDCWIQCGGYGLKSIDLDCENFIIPHDRRGLLGMANNGRHTDCSTQFFVLLQPAPWMAHKYVAFGQLIEGEETLRKIESVPTWYESPKSEIVIHQAGIFNMDCHDIMINKGANEYIHGHIEDLVALGELFYEALMEKVFLEVEFRRLARLEVHDEGEEGVGEEASGIRATRRFLRNKEDIEKQLQKSQADSRRGTSVVSEAENNDYDVEVYEYEPEEYSYRHVTPASTSSIIVKPEKPFYIPLTDVPYPGEVDSTYDLKKFLRGDYCLESDLKKGVTKKMTRETFACPSELLDLDEESVVESDESLDSDDEKEIRKYLKMNVDRVSFAGGIIKHIARGYAKFNLFEDARKSELISDDELRRLRLVSVDYRPHDDREKKVSISIPTAEKEPHLKIKRRQTGFVRPEDLERIRIIQKASSLMLTDGELDESTAAMARKVRIAPSAMATSAVPRPARRPTGFVRASEISDSDTEVQRQSVLMRLYDDVTNNDDAQGPTLKNYKPMSESHQKNLLLLTYSPNSRIKSDENTREKYMRHSVTIENESYEQVLNLQHGKKVARKISSDYVKTIDQIEHRLESSLRSIEFAKKRPSMSVLEYQKRNQKYQEKKKNLSESHVMTDVKPVANFGLEQPIGGLRLPGDTPLYSLSEDEDLM